ncbi:MAG: Crp/Fnr family transcriptional regulator [Flavobacteriales bacterium]|nr:Crp/Fnr family transcriptional regulator [Flavobacteriales bacterium]
MNNFTKLWWLEKIHLFEGLSDKEMLKVEQRSTMKTKEKGTHIYFPNEPSKIIFFLKNGRVKIGSYSPDGKEIIKAIMHPGDMFGEMGLVGEETRNDFAIAMDDDVRVCTLNVEEILDMMRGNAELGLKITTTIGNRLSKVERKFESLIFKDARTRIVDLIREMATERGKVLAGGEVLLEHSLTHQDLASLTATSRQTVTTVLNELKEKELINFDRKTILIHQTDKLV